MQYFTPTAQSLVDFDSRVKQLSMRPPGPGRGSSLRSHRSVGREHGIDGLALDSQTVRSPTHARVTRGEARRLQRHGLTSVPRAAQATVSRRVQMHFIQTGCLREGLCLTSAPPHKCSNYTFHFHALEKEMATYSSVLAWRIPGTGEPGGLPVAWSRTRLK